MKKLVAAFIALQVAGTPVFSQQRPQQRPARRVLQDAVLGFYVSEFQQQAEVSGETFAKILPFLQQFVQDRFAVRVEVQPIPTPSRRLGATVVPSSWNSPIELSQFPPSEKLRRKL